MLTDEQFRETPSYERLCRDYGLDPALPLDAQSMAAGDARQFWVNYDGLRATADPQTAEQVAAELARLVRDGEAHHRAAGQPGPLLLIQAWGPLVAVQSEDGQAWAATVAPADEAAIAAAMTAAAAGLQSLS